MKARITIDIDTDHISDKRDSIEAVAEVAEEVFTSGLRWSLLNAGSSQYLPRLWAEAQAEGCRLAITEDAGNCWQSKTQVTDKWFEQDLLIANIRRVLTNEELCAEAMVAEIGELVNREEVEQ